MSIVAKSQLLSQIARKSISSVVPKRNTHFTPPRVRVSFAEKVVHGILITVGCSAVPVWVLCNLENYKNGNK